MTIPMVTLAQVSRRYVSQSLRNGVFMLLVGGFLDTVVAQAQSTWLAVPGTGLWNTATNWTPTTVPTDTALFDQSNRTTITFSGSTSVGSIQFNALAPTYTFPITGVLTITGAGIVNNSSNSPVFGTMSGGANGLDFVGVGATADNATILAGPTFTTSFRGTSTAGTATITSNGGTTEFFDTSTAGSATITTGLGSSTFFSDTSTGGQARLITNAGGIVDISGLTSGAMTVGSIEGTGNYFLGGNALTVGSSNLPSVEVAGTILDGGRDNGTGASLIKVGTGMLILSGVNTYSGGTTVAGGVLRVADDRNLGATLGGITLQGGELLTTEGTFSSTRLVTLSTAGPPNTLAAAPGTTANYSGAVGGSGGLQVGDGTNTGIVVLSSGANAYLGGTTILGGASLSVDTDLELGDSSGAITLNGGKLLVTNLFTARTVTLLGAGTNALAAPDVAARYFPTFAGLITGGGGLTVGDTNSLTLFLTLANATNTPNDYSGGTTITGGATLIVDTDEELGNLNGGITLAGGKLQTTTDGFSSARIITLIPGSKPNSILIGFGQTATYTGAIGGTGGLTFQNGTAVLTNSNNSYAGGTTIAHATLIVDTDAELGALSGGITLMGGTLVSTVGGFTSARSILLNEAEGNDTLAATVGTTATYTGSISGAAPLFVDSVGEIVAPGTVVLTNATNSYTAGTTVEDGATLSVDVDAELGAPSGGLTLSGGELLTTTEFASARTILLQRGIDILAAATGTMATYSGVISDNGRDIGLVVGDGANHGTVVLASGANTYSGGTTVLNTTLIVDTNAELGASSGGLTLEGGELLTTANGFASTRTIQLRTGTDILAAATGTTATYSGVISLNGVVLTIGDGLSNNGTVVLASGANTYNGGTLVLGSATLSVNSDAELGNISGGIALRFGGELLTTSNFTSARSVSLDPEPMGAGIVTPLKRQSTNTLAATANTTATYTGVVFGTGGLAVGEISGNHPGLVVLTNLANSYTGGTIVQGAATLSVADDANLGDPSGGITLATGELLTTASGFDTTRSVDLRATAGRNTLSASTGTTATYLGVLSDEGTLVINDAAHAGTVVLAGNNTYSGGTLIERGTLLVDNPQALGNGDVIVNGGILAADPQPINVLGNYTQSAAGTLRLSIAGRAAGQFDVLNVTGNAALNGTLQLLNLGYHPQGGDQLRLITTGGVVSSRFSQFINPFLIGPGFNTVNLVYARKSVTLEFLELATPVIPLPPGTPGTPSAPTVVITTDFSSFAFTPNQSAAANLLDAVQLDPRAADLISFLNTEPFANLPNDFQKISPEGLTAFYEIGFSSANMQKLTLEGRLDDLHNGSNGFTSNMKVNGATVMNDKAGGDGKSAQGVVEPVLQQAPENRWGVWVTGFGDFVNVDGDGNARGYDFTTGGVSLGIDYRITDQLAIGVMSDYSHTWTSLNPNGHLDVDSGRGGLYATWYSRGWYVNGAIYGGHDNYDSSRSGLGGLASGGTEGSEWSTFLSGGYDFHFGPLTVGPLTSLQYTDVGINSFSEKGSLAPLDIHSGSAESLRSDAGFRAFYQWQIGKMVVEPSIKAAWEHEYKYSALPITVGFAGITGPSATFFGPSEGHDSAVVSAGVSVQVTPAITTYVNYDGQLGRGNYDSNAVTGGVRISF